ncbi:hypothetical protein [Streptomyces sp. NPDC001536]|uniref:zinc finger domain-containing protein n=1 Tax=Streptomyces sp. NPDC001536 TaxID=3364583 RepID=UPI0036D058A4
MKDDLKYETDAEVNTTDLMSGKKITVDEMAVEVFAIELRLRQLARAAEVPDTPVELSDTIDNLRSWASSLRTTGDALSFLARVVAGDVPLSTTFLNAGDPWGAAARGTDRADYGGPAIVPTHWQLTRLAQDAKRAPTTTTYPEAMAGVGLGWESKSASIRRRRERDAAVAREVLLIRCERCGSSDGEQCRTNNGRVSEKPHAGRQREAEATVDGRLGHLGENPVAVPNA